MGCQDDQRERGFTERAQEFGNESKYPLRSLVFFPRNKVKILFFLSGFLRYIFLILGILGLLWWHQQGRLPVDRGWKLWLCFPSCNSATVKRVSYHLAPNSNILYLSYRFRLYIRTHKAELHAMDYQFNREVNFAPIAITEDLKELHGRIVECRYVNGQWKLVRIRNDRPHPHSRRSVMSNCFFFVQISMSWI